jgi:hypothetical protein
MNARRRDFIVRTPNVEVLDKGRVITVIRLFIVVQVASLELSVIFSLANTP